MDHVDEIMDKADTLVARAGLMADRILGARATSLLDPESAETRIFADVVEDFEADGESLPQNPGPETKSADACHGENALNPEIDGSSANSLAAAIEAADIELIEPLQVADDR